MSSQQQFSTEPADGSPSIERCSAGSWAAAAALPFGTSVASRLPFHQTPDSHQRYRDRSHGQQCMKVVHGRASAIRREQGRDLHARYGRRDQADHEAWRPLGRCVTPPRQACGRRAAGREKSRSHKGSPGRCEKLVAKEVLRRGCQCATLGGSSIQAPSSTTRLAGMPRCAAAATSLRRCQTNTPSSSRLSQDRVGRSVIVSRPM